jgi:ribosomal peptide maturation radical SAM protein 1
VLLVCPPYSAIEKPSIALSILKSTLTRAGIASRVVYANLDFAAELGPHLYGMLSNSYSHGLVGEWTFSRAAFPGLATDDEAYLAHVQPALRSLLSVSPSFRSTDEIAEVFRYVRGQAARFVDRVAAALVAASPRVVACTSTFQQHCAALAVLRRVKELRPSIVTMLGGANCEASMGLVTHRECPWVDIVVSGEGEDLFPELCTVVIDLDGDVASLAAIELPRGALGPRDRANGHGRYRFGAPPRAMLEDMARSPAPDYDDYFTALAASPVAPFIEPGLLLETSRGCWWGAVSHCTFCGLNGGSMAFRAKQPAQAVEEIVALTERHHITRIQVVDNILDMKYFQTVMPEIARRGGEYDIFYETKSNLDRRHVELMAAAGVRWLQPGIESFDDDILRAIAKGTTGMRNLQMMKWCAELGIDLDWILLYDIPGESDDVYLKMAEWLPLVFHLQPPNAVSFIQYNRFSPYHTRASDFGLRLEPDRSYEYVYPWSAAARADFAYFFDDYSRPRDQIHGDTDAGIRRPGLRAVQRVIQRWVAEWSTQVDPTRPRAPGVVLYGEETSDALVLTDTRSDGPARSVELRGLPRRVYEACDRAGTRTSIERRLRSEGGAVPPWGETEEALDRLCREKLVLRLGDHWLSLATRGPPRALPPMNRHPGGRILTLREVRAGMAAPPRAGPGDQPRQRA